MLAAPLTVCLVILGKYVPQLKFFDVLLGDEPALTPDISFYQRLLARDEDEASDIAHEQLRSLSLPQLFDRLLVPALVYAKRDLANDRLSEGDADFIIQATRDILEEESFDELAKERQNADEDRPADAEALSSVEILACAADDEADEAALAMFERMLDPKICRLDILSTSSLVSEVVTRVEQERPAAVLIATLPPGGLAKTRLLCKRLRTRFPDLKIVVGRWGLRANADGNREQLVAAGANHFATSMEQTAAQMAQLAQFLRPAAKKLRVDDPSPTAPGHTATTVLT
jgi:hypothetical protein